MSHVRISPLPVIVFVILLVGTMLASPLLPPVQGAEPCEPWIATIVSIQGIVEIQRIGQTQWNPAQLGDTYCPGDILHTHSRSRAALILHNDTTLRVDENTTLTFVALEDPQISVLDLLRGAFHFLSRTPRGLKLTTPFINAGVEGTEFWVRVELDRAVVTVIEGLVLVSNEFGSLTLSEGESAIAEADKAPVLQVVIRPRDAVQWALYYPAVRDYRPEDFPGEVEWQRKVRQSIELYRKGDLVGAFSSLEGVEDVGDPRFFVYRGGLLLTVGQVEEARGDLEKALRLDPNHSPAISLQAIIAVVQNDKEGALSLAEKAVELDAKSSSARVALSYARQASFDLEGALKSLQEAVELAPEDSLARARLSELWLSVGDLDKALKVAREAVKLNPQLARTQVVLGFAYLAQIKTKRAEGAFEKAIQLDQADPLPRLGLGLAKIREGELEEGRKEIEIATSLDPNNSLIRSYLGKGYYEEKRDQLSRDQLTIAKELDPKDPTPWFYDAIRKQTVNRPVEALKDLQRSIELNDSRAVYRSRLLLDDDLAARSASLGRIYSDLGFQQLALVEGWRSLNTDPGNYSAHRFLADSYSVLPRHEIARVSELLQSQLLQPINITPIQPQLAETNLFILSGAGPSEPSFNEFNPLFNRDRFTLQADGLAGENDTLGEDAVHSGVQGGVSYSVGQFHYETEGFRENNDQEIDIYNAFVQVALSNKTSVQAEFRSTDTESGDLELNFNPENFSPTLRRTNEFESLRGGLHHAFSPHSDIIASIIYQDADFHLNQVNIGQTSSTEFDQTRDEDSFSAELQYLFRREKFNIISGVGHFNADLKVATTFTLIIQTPTEPIISVFPSVAEDDLLHTNLYGYARINYPKSITWTLGGSADFFDGEIVDHDQFNPKVGLTWNPLPDTTLRAAVFRILKRQLVANQTLEPTQVAGFNQFFDDTNGAQIWHYGAAIDQKFSPSIYGGVEFFKRALDVPFLRFLLSGETQVLEADWEEQSGRAYLYWTLHPWLAVSAEYQYERFDRDLELTFGIAKVRTHRIPLGINFFHPSGFSVRLRATYFDQEGDFQDPTTFSDVPVPGSDQFCIVDADIGYRLPKRWGLITVGAKNVLGEDFKFEDTDLASPSIQPERLIFARFTLAW